MNPRHVVRNGVFYRVADPEWSDPLDGRYAGASGGRWNPPGAFPVVYLGASMAVARANVLRRFEGHPFGVEDVAPEAGPDLVEAAVPERRFVDVVSDSGCRAVGLPATYPRRGLKVVGWEECQPIGRAAWDAGEPGIAARSAAPGLTVADEELAWFDRGVALELLRRRRFADWFWPA